MRTRHVQYVYIYIYRKSNFPVSPRRIFEPISDKPIYNRQAVMGAVWRGRIILLLLLLKLRYVKTPRTTVVEGEKKPPKKTKIFHLAHRS